MRMLRLLRLLVYPGPIKTGRLEFGHKELLETLQIFDQSDVKTKRQNGKKTKDKKTKKEFNIVISGQFRTLAMLRIQKIHIQLRKHIQTHIQIQIQ